MYNVVERPDHEFAAVYFDGDENDWFYANHAGVGQADPTRWNYLTGELADKDMTISANYAEMQQYLDVRSFADYLLATFFIGLTDWPDNNCTFRWRIACVFVASAITLINRLLSSTNRVCLSTDGFFAIGPYSGSVQCMGWRTESQRRRWQWYHHPFGPYQLHG